MSEYSEVMFHTFKYFLSPQLDIYKNVRELIIEPLQKRAQKYSLLSDIHVLDIGSGNGIGVVQMITDHALCVGCDVDKNAVDLANDLFGNIASFKCVDAANPVTSLMPPWDVITCIEVIEHVDDSVQLLRNIKRLLTLDGSAVITTLNHNSQYRKNRTHLGAKFKVCDFRELVTSVFPQAVITDFMLTDELSDDSSITPMVAVINPPFNFRRLGDE